MKLVLSQLPKGGRDIAYTAPADLFADLGEDVSVARGIRVEGRAEREGGGLRLYGRISGEVGLVCSRCLARFAHQVDEPFDVTYSRAVSDEDEVLLEQRELAVCHLEGDEVDVSGLVHEQVLLALPMAPLCGEACKGLCPRCGTNLNEAGCGCAEEAVDPRFAVLKKLQQ